MVRPLRAYQLEDEGGKTHVPARDSLTRVPVGPSRILVQHRIIHFTNSHSAPIAFRATPRFCSRIPVRENALYTPSATLSAIREISQWLKPQLTDLGWRRKSPHFIRERGTLIHGIHFQASQFGSADSGTFTINLVVTEPRVYQAWSGRALPANPVTALFPVRQRIGFLDLNPRDHWWNITASTNLREVQIEVLNMLLKAEERFFTQFMSLESILDRLRATGVLPGLHGGQCAVVHGLIAAILGHSTEAKRVLGKLVANSSVPGFARNVREAAKNVGITV